MSLCVSHLAHCEQKLGEELIHYLAQWHPGKFGIEYHSLAPGPLLGEERSNYKHYRVFQ